MPHSSQLYHTKNYSSLTMICQWKKKKSYDTVFCSIPWISFIYKIYFILILNICVCQCVGMHRWRSNSGGGEGGFPWGFLMPWTWRYRWLSAVRHVCSETNSSPLHVPCIPLHLKHHFSFQNSELRLNYMELPSWNIHNNKMLLCKFKCKI